MGLSGNALVFLRMLGTLLPVGLLICATDRSAFRVRRADNRVLPGIRLVASLLEAGVLQIGEQCRDAIREFRLYRWEDQEGKDGVVKENDHAMDDIRYFCASVLRRKIK
jgi:hypothetical protein